MDGKLRRGVRQVDTISSGSALSSRLLYDPALPSRLSVRLRRPRVTIVFVADKCTCLVTVLLSSRTSAAVAADGAASRPTTAWLVGVRLVTGGTEPVSVDWDRRCSAAPV